MGGKKGDGDVMGRKMAVRLAHTDKKVRDKAMKVLSRFFARSDRLSEEEMMRIWKGLFYCMWYSDKRLVQNELAQRMAALMHQFPSVDLTLSYVRAFFKTMQREWSRLDQHRLDKFYYLIEMVLAECFQVLGACEETLDPEEDGSPNTMVSRLFANMIFECICMSSSEKFPSDEEMEAILSEKEGGLASAGGSASSSGQRKHRRLKKRERLQQGIPMTHSLYTPGLLYHVCECFVRIAVDHGGYELHSNTWLALLRPFACVLAHTHHKSLRERLLEKVFYAILEAMDPEIVARAMMEARRGSDGEEEEAEDEEEEEEMEVELIPVPHDQFAAMMLEFSSRPNTPAPNRAILLKLKRRAERILEKVKAMQEEEEEEGEGEGSVSDGEEDPLASLRHEMAEPHKVEIPRHVGGFLIRSEELERGKNAASGDGEDGADALDLMTVLGALQSQGVEMPLLSSLMGAGGGGGDGEEEEEEEEEEDAPPRKRSKKLGGGKSGKGGAASSSMEVDGAKGKKAEAAASTKKGKGKGKGKRKQKQQQQEKNTEQGSVMPSPSPSQAFKGALSTPKSGKRDGTPGSSEQSPRERKVRFSLEKTQVQEFYKTLPPSPHLSDPATRKLFAGTSQANQPEKQQQQQKKKKNKKNKKEKQQPAAFATGASAGGAKTGKGARKKSRRGAGK